jgi:hypothetical protein
VAQARRRAGLIGAGARVRRTGSRGVALLLVAASAAVAGCADGAGRALAERHPRLRAIAGQRLAESNPYVLLADGRATFFYCRWPDGAPIPVALPADASPDERRALEAALRAWEGAGLGVHFERVAPGAGAIDLTLVGGAVDTAAGQDTANTVVDCRVAPLAEQPPDADPVVGARLVAARIHIARTTNQDWQGHARPITPGELTGAALHELGHALGFQGHAHAGDTVMVREVERIARTGQEVLDGVGFADPSLRALYALPSGTVLARVEVGRCRTDLVDRMARLGEAHGLAGPYLRVGEVVERLFWRAPDGGEYGLIVGHLREALRDPTRLLVLPESSVRASLAKGRDVRCE